MFSFAQILARSGENEGLAHASTLFWVSSVRRTVGAALAKRHLVMQLSMQTK